MPTPPEEPNPPLPTEPAGYQVGYQRPPRETRFRKGQSGNPKGRPKGQNNFRTDLAAELNELIRITEGGTTKVLTKQQALIKRTMEKACKGDMRAIEALIKWRGVYLAEEVSEETPLPLPLEDQAILDRALATRAGTFSPPCTQEISDEETS